MKTTGCWGWVFGFIFALTFPPLARSQDAALAASRTGATNLVQEGALRSAAPQWRAKTRTAHQTEWSSARYHTNAATGKVRATTNSYIELGTGLNRKDESGRWQRSSDAFQITTNGAEANLGQHRVKLAGNINSAGSVQIEKGGVKMQGHPLCIAYYDPVDGRSELLGDLKDAVGWLVSSNEVVFSNCFNGIHASIRYRNSRSGLEQDLILHERPSITPQELGFSDKTRLELFTEWIGDTPVPTKETRVLQGEKTAMLRQQMVEPDFSDQTLKFGGLRMGAGRAFNTDGNAGVLSPRSEMGTVPVGKRFEIIEGRKILIEAVPMRSAEPMLNKLPAARSTGALTNAAINSRSRRGNEAQTATLKSSPLNVQTNNRSLTSAATVQKGPTLSTFNHQPSPPNLHRLLPAKRLAQTGGDHRIQTASALLNPQLPHLSTSVPQVAFVLDWNLQLDDPIYDFTFSGTNTYRCSGTVNLDGTTTFEAGTVVKYDEGSAYAILQIFGPVDCKTELYRPAFFTSVYDNTVGENIAIGTPGRYFQALAIGSTGQQLKHLRISYAEWALHSYEINLRHSQITHCEVAFATDQGACNVGNVLVQDTFLVFMGYNFTAKVAHLTANQCSFLAVPYSGWSAGDCSVTFWNSLLVDVSAPGAVPTSKNSTVDWPPTSGSLPYPFQTVSAGAHYLNDSSYRNAGTVAGAAAIDADFPTLKTELALMTTYPPTPLSGTATPNLILAVRPGLGDSDALDFGYHYPIIDYAIDSLIVANSTVLLTNGVVITPVGNYGFWLKGGEIVSEGWPQKPNRLLPYSLIQEQRGAWNNTTFYPYANPLSTPSKLSLRFTSLDKHQYSSHHIHAADTSMYPGSRISIRDSHLLGGELYLGAGLASGTVFGLTNNAFENVFMFADASPTLSLYNNLFSYSTIWLARAVGSSWLVHDNIFRNTYIGDGNDGILVHTHNAFFESVYEDYLTSLIFNQMSPPGTGEQILSSLYFEPGPFGKFYLPATATQLIDQGSRNAAAGGLYHYTTIKNPASKEAFSPVDIGLHYVGATAANLPIDSDGDGLPDYFEDKNGDGIGLVRISAIGGDATATEAGPVAGRFTITRDEEDFSRAFTVNLSLATGTGHATAGTDYSAVPSSVPFSAGQQTATINVTPSNDIIDEPSETVTLGIAANPAAYTIGTPASATVAIQDDDLATVSISSAAGLDAIAREAGQVAGRFTITRVNDDKSRPLTVFFNAQLGGNATHSGVGADYTAAPGVSSATIGIGSDTAIITITPVNDTVDEQDETVSLTITPNAAYTIGTASATVTIQDDDLPMVSITADGVDGKAWERDLVSGKFTISRQSWDNSAALPLTIQVTGVAVSGVDYVPITPPVTLPVTIPAGQSQVTVPVVPLDDSIDEIDETVVLTVLGTANYSVAASPANQATIVIFDKPTVTVAATTATTQESGQTPGRFTITRASGDNSAELTVYYSFAGVANGGIDYVSHDGVKIVPAGLTSAFIDIFPIEDSEYEEAEVVQVLIAPDSKYSLGTVSAAALTIQDNDLPSVSVVAWDNDAAEPRLGLPANPGSISISRNGNADSPLSVLFSFATGSQDGTAANGSDFSVGTSVSFLAGENERSVTITPIQDGIYEGTERIIVNLLANANYRIEPSRSQAVILVKDADIPTVRVTPPNPALVSEGAGVTQFTFYRSAPANGGITEPLKVLFRLHGSAANGLDYATPTSATYVTIPANIISAALPISLINDVESESIETMIATIAGSLKYLISGSENTATIKIDDSEPTSYAVTVLKPHVPISEVPSEDLYGRFRITRLGTAAAQSTIAYQTEYVNASGVRSGLQSLSAVFPVGESSVERSWQGNVGGTSYLEIRVPNTPIARMPCFRRPVGMSFPDHLNFVEQEIQEGPGSATLRVTGPPNTTVRINADSGSADLWEVQSSVPFTWDPYTQRSGLWVTLSSAGIADVTFSAPNDGVSGESVEYIAFRFDPTYAMRGANWPIDPVAAIQTAYWPGIPYKNSVSGGLNTFSEYNNHAVLRIRDISIGYGIQPDPPVDVDLDGLRDSWERNYDAIFPVVNGFNGPLLPDDPDADPDRDGLSNHEESLLAGSSPHSADSDGNGVNDFLQFSPPSISDDELVEVKFKIVDSGKIAIPSQNCAVCHTTRLKVGEHSLSNPKRDAALEKVFPFRKGQSYPVRLETLVVQQNRTGSQTIAPHTTAAYTAELLPVGNNVTPQFLILDPQSILGSKLWSSSLNTKQATLVVPKIELLVDLNRDGQISLDGSDSTSASHPFRFWINDDADSGDVGNGDVPGTGGNISNVTGVRDLLDYFPVFLSIKDTVQLLPPSSGVEYRLNHAGGKICFLTTSLSRSQARSYLTDRSIAELLSNRPVTSLPSANPAILEAAWIEQIRTQSDMGVILVQGFQATDQPLVLEMWKDGKKFAETKLELNIGNVEGMFRHINLLGVVGASGGRQTEIGEPSLWPDSLSSAKNFIFLHGYNVNPTAARGWNAEVFKRLWWSGSRARFYGVTWAGSYSQIGPITPNYHANVVNALRTGAELKRYLNDELSGENIVAGHSLGNMVVLGALNDHAARISKYFMIDAAVAIEALQANAVKSLDMVHRQWEWDVGNFPGCVFPQSGKYAEGLWASEWHMLFPLNDGRRSLTWRGRLQNLQNSVVYNFYSSGEEVLQTHAHNDDPLIPDIVLAGAGRYAWALQEKLKGRIEPGFNGLLGSTGGGWGMNAQYKADPNCVGSIDSPGCCPLKPFEVDYLVNDPLKPLKSKPFFRQDGLTLPLLASGSGAVHASNNRDRLLAEAFPARTEAIGANNLPDLAPPLGGGRNFNMNTAFQNGWPTSRTSQNDFDWRHSDIRDVAYVYVFQAFNKLVELGSLNQ